jgi:hypothetical protein
MELQLKPPSVMEQQERMPRTTLLVMAAFHPGPGFMDHLLCNHIHVMESLRDSQDAIEVNSVNIKQGQLHGDTAFVTTDTEWNLSRWGYGPDGHITEFGAADAEDTVLVTDLQPIPSAGREMTKKTRELRVAMEWVIARSPDGRPLHQYISGGGYLDGKYLGADMKHEGRRLDCQSLWC